MIRSIDRSPARSARRPARRETRTRGRQVGDLGAGGDQCAGQPTLGGLGEVTDAAAGARVAGHRLGQHSHLHRAGRGCERRVRPRPQVDDEPVETGQHRGQHRPPAGRHRPVPRQAGAGREPVGRDRITTAGESEQRGGDEQPVGGPGAGRRRQPGHVEIVVQHAGVPAQCRSGGSGAQDGGRGDLGVLAGGDAERDPGRRRVDEQPGDALDQLGAQRVERREAERVQVEGRPVAAGRLGLRRRQQYIHGHAPYGRR